MFENCIPDQSKLDIRKGVHQEGDDFKIALFLQSHAIDMNRSSITYDPKGEISGPGYAPGGQSLTGFTRQTRQTGEGDITYIDFEDPVWEKASFTADAAVIYNASRSNKSLVILGFGPHVLSNGIFSVTLSTPHISLITIADGKVYGPGEYNLTEGGLTLANLRDLCDVTDAMNGDLPDHERNPRFLTTELMRANLHYRFDDRCDHSSEACPYHGVQFIIQALLRSQLGKPAPTPVGKP